MTESLPRNPQNVQKAVTFFTQANLHRLLAKLREKYIEIGRVGGQVLLENTTPGERREIASFLARPPYADSNLKIKLSDIEKALQHSFNCGVPELLAAFFPGQPLVTHQAKREAHAIHQADFSARLLSIASKLPEESQGKHWLQYGQHGQEWIYSRFKNSHADEQDRQLKLVRYIANVLNQLPEPDAPERLALFAQRTCGDPHALDSNMPAGRLLLLALNDLAQGLEENSSQPTKTPQDREQELRLYKDAGLLVDTVSSSVAIFNLASAIYHNDASDPLVQAAGKRVLLLPMRQLLEWKCLTPASTRIYMFENPQVFEEVISALESASSLPTLVCTSGWPSAATLRLLDQLLEESPDNCLYYSGDFDLKGLQIATYLAARYPGRCHPWHFDATSYEVALKADGIEAPSGELKMLSALPEVFKPLVTRMQEKQKWAFQEGIVELLVNDLRASSYS
ncbi:MAG: TIGR02679 family protein [Ktedonobacteraceae bacterium]